jgi:universal stress protein F
MKAQTILVALDGSTRAVEVRDAALQLATKFGGHLHFYRAAHVSPEVVPTMFGEGVPRLDDLVQEGAERGLRELIEPVPAELCAGVHVDLAVAWDGICRAAEEIGADVIVMGSHTYSRWDRLLGTTAAKVVNHAPCTVIVVRVEEDAAPH